MDYERLFWTLGILYDADRVKEVDRNLWPERNQFRFLYRGPR